MPEPITFRIEHQMPLKDYISGNEEDQISEVADYLSHRWSDVLDEELVLNLRSEMDSPTWTGHRFEVQEVKVGTDDIRARFTFVAKGLDDQLRGTGEEIYASAVAVIDEYDGLTFTNIEAER